jgi:D-alanyl-D-alanine carboxypeptidase/D-alanyl-D-alanine-endopeptidase (penicillin-binding protein 4)
VRIRRPWLLGAGVAALVAVVTALAVVLGLTGSGRPAAPPPAAGTGGTAPIRVPAVLPVPAGAMSAGPAGLRAALAAGLRDPALGRGAAAVVVDAGSGRSLLSTGTTAAVPPASTAKILTAVAALERLGGRSRLETRVVTGSRPDSLVLVGGGDSTLAGPEAPRTYPAPARLADLASGAARELAAAGVRRVRLTVDASLFAGPPLGPAWSPGYLTAGDVAPVSALEVDGGRVRPGARARSPDPALAAGRLFGRLLGRAGVTVVGQVSAARAPASAVPLAVVRSPTVASLVERMLTDSDNDLAEALARLVALRSGAPATFAGGAAAVRRAVVALGVDPSAVALYDGSGLSKANRLQPRVLTTLLSLAASPGHPELRPVLTGLPVAGLTGTLTDRYAAPPALGAAGLVRAKTGTLTGVSTLAGVTLDVDGELLAFALVAPAAPERRGAERALDRLAAVLAGCGCR